MTQQPPKLEWQVCDDEIEWRAVLSAAQPVQPPLPARQTGRSLRRRRWVLAALLAVLLPASIAGYRDVRQADQAMDRVENDVAAAVAADAWVQTTHDRAGQHKTPALCSTPPRRSRKSLGWRCAAWRCAATTPWSRCGRLSPTEPWLPAPYRQTRFYHETAAGLAAHRRRRTSSGSRSPRSKSGRFTFVYGPPDAAAVLAVSAQIEEIDVTVRRDLGLPPTEAPVTIRVVHTLPPDLDPASLYALVEGANWRVPSPALLALPLTTGDDAALRQLIAGSAGADCSERNVRLILGEL